VKHRNRTRKRKNAHRFAIMGVWSKKRNEWRRRRIQPIPVYALAEIHIVRGGFIGGPLTP
jgi:hypothetical protein